MPKKAKYKPIAKSKNNTSGRPSAAKQEAMDRKAGKKIVKKKPKKQMDYNVKLSALNPKQPKQLPETYYTLKGMTLRQLLKSTPRLFVNNAIDVVVTKLTKTKTKSGMPAVSAVCYTSDPYRPNKIRRNHNVYIIGLDKDKNGNPDTKKPVNKHSKVLVSCPCESFVFGGGEYANAARGASRIVYGNGNPPVVTNPGLLPFCCKHLVATGREAIVREL